MAPPAQLVRDCVPTEGFAGPEASSRGGDRVRLPAPAPQLEPKSTALSQRQDFRLCPTLTPTAGLEGAARGADACRVSAWCSQTSARPAKPRQRPVCSAPDRPRSSSPEGPSLPLTRTCSRHVLAVAVARGPRSPASPGARPTPGDTRGPGAASRLNRAGSHSKGQGMEINAPAAVSSCPLAGLFYSGSLNMYILLHALLQY